MDVRRRCHFRPFSHKYKRQKLYCMPSAVTETHPHTEAFHEQNVRKLKIFSILRCDEGFELTSRSSLVCSIFAQIDFYKLLSHSHNSVLASFMKCMLQKYKYIVIIRVY